MSPDFKTSIPLSIVLTTAVFLAFRTGAPPSMQNVENWDCGGNMRSEYYADVYRRYQTYVRNLSGKKSLRRRFGL